MKKIVVLLLSILTVVMLCTSCAPPKDSGASTGNSSVKEELITITFNTDSKVEVPAIEVPVGEAPAIPEAPVVDGFVFAGWYFDAEFENRYFFDYPLEENTTLYAKFYDTSLGEYIVISNVDQFIAIKDDTTAKYLLACNINCKGNTLEPITGFSGELEGNGYKIFNFAMNKATDYLSFFIYNRGIIKNVSFDDFVYDVQKGDSTTKHYALISSYNYGTIENCHVLNGEVKLNVGTTMGQTMSFGVIASFNSGRIEKCTNNAKVTATGWCQGSYGSYVFFGGIVGYIEKEGTVKNCINSGEISFIIKVNDWMNFRAGGVAGINKGLIDASANIGNVNFKCETEDRYKSTTSYIGGFVGDNMEGEVKNCYADCNLNVDAPINVATGSIGGFVGLNTQKIHNCYSNVNLNAKCNNYVIGGFVGNDLHEASKQSLITKSFALGSIVINAENTNIGCFAGYNTGDISGGVYAESLAISLKTVAVDEESGEEVETITPVEATCSDGEAMAEAELLSVNYLENTLYFDRMVWLLVEGKLPALR